MYSYLCRYHLDEILACTMLLSLKEFKNSRICRSRDNNDLEKCSILVDVGGEYNLKNNHFDHHQRSFQQYFDFDRFASSGSQRGWNGNGDRDGSQNAEESCKRMKRKPVTKLSSAGLIFLHYAERILKERYGECFLVFMVSNKKTPPCIVRHSIVRQYFFVAHLAIMGSFIRI